MSAARKSLEPFLRDDIEYFDYQVAGVRELHPKPSFLLADDMGLGKSLQALTVFCIDVKLGRANTLLIVCPVTLRMNWAKEIKKFTRLPYTLLGEEELSNGNVKKLSVAKRHQQLLEFFTDPGPRILIANYEQIAAEAHTAVFASALFDAVIFDEAHYIKNPDSKRSQACLRVRAKRNFLLTGTPLLNHVNELWTLLHKINPQRYPRYWSFVNRYCVFGGYENRKVIGTKNEKELVEELRTVMVRRLKTNVLKLGEPQVIPINVSLTAYQRKLYDRAMNDLELESASGEEAADIDGDLAKFTRLKQICATPFCLGEEYTDDSYKLDQAIDLIQQFMDKGEKVGVFTQFRPVIVALQRRLKTIGLKQGTFELTGDVPPPQRVPLVDEWAKHPDPLPILCMSQVAGVGLNMTASSTVIRIDKLFVPGLNNQVVDRFNRIGQTKPVQVFDITAVGTVEYRVEEILREKVKLNEDIVEGSVALGKLMRELKEKILNGMS